MGYGRSCPRGTLPVFSVNTNDEAEKLLSRCCERVTYGTDYKVGYIAAELEENQTLANLYAFGDRLAAEYKRMMDESAHIKEDNYDG